MKTLEQKINSAEYRVRDARWELRKLRAMLPQESNGFPRIAEGRGAWRGQIHLVLGTYTNSFGGTSWTTRRIKDDGTLSQQAAGCAVLDDWEGEPHYLPDSEAVVIAEKYKAKRRWAREFQVEA